jgi:hypothetical protein
MFKMRLNTDQDYLRRSISSRVSELERFVHLPVDFPAPKTFKVASFATKN